MIKNALDSTFTLSLGTFVFAGHIMLIEHRVQPLVDKVDRVGLCVEESFIKSGAHIVSRRSAPSGGDVMVQLDDGSKIGVHFGSSDTLITVSANLNASQNGLTESIAKIPNLMDKCINKYSLQL